MIIIFVSRGPGLCGNTVLNRMWQYGKRVLFLSGAKLKIFEKHNRKMMTMLVEREDSQYSYRNTLVAMDGDQVVGISVSYDGGKLRQLRLAFIEAAKEYLGKDHSGMEDETQAGEFYLDSLAVLPEYRRQGIYKYFFTYLA